MIKKILYLFIGFLLVITCEKEAEKENLKSLEGLIKLNEGYLAGASTKIEIWGKGNYFTGYNELSVVLYDSLSPDEMITDSHIEIVSELNPGEDNDNVPAENPPGMAVDGVFKGAVVFTEPSPEWKLNIDIHNHITNKYGSVEFEAHVIDPSEDRLIYSISSGSPEDTFYIALVQPFEPAAGLKEFELAIFSGNSVEGYTYSEGLFIEAEAQMPLSKNALAPVHIELSDIGKGHYRGEIDFSIAGPWNVEFIIRQNDMDILQNSFIIAVK